MPEEAEPAIRIEKDAQTGEYHIWDSEHLALTLSHDEAVILARALPRMSRAEALKVVADLLTDRGVTGQTAQMMLLIDDLVRLVG